MKHEAGNLQEARAHLEFEKHVVACIARGAPLDEVLDTIARGVEARSRHGLLCAIHQLDAAGERLARGAAPSLPAAYLEELVGARVGPCAGSCGTAVHTRQRVDVVDISRDPLWAEWRELAARHKLAACFSRPLIAADGTVIGTIAMYYRTPGAPAAGDEALIALAHDTALVAIESERARQALRAKQEELLESERHARGEAERASRMKDEFLATLSHELRTPLAAILGWTHLMRTRPPGPEGLARGLEIVERNARVQTQLIEDLLDMSRITSGKLRLEVQTVAPVDVLQAAVETVRPAADARGVRLELALDPAAGPVAGDPARLQQVAWNLLSNAIKFTPRGGRVQVLLARVDSHVEITVTDTGAGIDPEFLAHAFQRFRQADASTTRQYGGLGLGLSIVKHLVELHGGTVNATSAGPGAGSTFVVHLPVCAVQLAGPSGTRAHPRADAGAAMAFRSADLSGVRVLVVDDQPDSCQLVARVLQECNASVVTATGAQEALRLLEREPPDLLLSDIGMPGMDGYELIARLRALEASRGGRVPAIAMTAFARSEDRTRALHAGFQIHVAKPVEPSELVASVASLVGRAGLLA